MPTPLVMLGSGDYATRLNVKGTRLLKSKGPQNHGQANPDPDQAPNHSGYHRPQNNFNRGKFSPSRDTAAAPKRPARDDDTFNLTAPLHAAFAWLQLQSLTLSDLAAATKQDSQTLAPKPTDSVRGSTPTPKPQPAFVLALRAAKAKLRAAQPAPRVAITPIPANFRNAPTPPAQEAHGFNPWAQPQPSNPTPRRDPHEPHPQTAGHPQPHPRNPLDPRLFADDAGARRRARRLQSDRLRTRRSPDQKRSPQTASQQSPLFGSVA